MFSVMLNFLILGHMCHNLAFRHVSHLLPWERLRSVSIPWILHVVDLSIVTAIRLVYAPNPSLSHTDPMEGEGGEHPLPPAFWYWKFDFVW